MEGWWRGKEEGRGRGPLPAPGPLTTEVWSGSLATGLTGGAGIWFSYLLSPRGVHSDSTHDTEDPPQGVPAC